VQRLSRLFKHEFRFRADAPFSEIFGDTVARMKGAGEVIETADGMLDAGAGRLGWSGREWLLTYATFLKNFVEGYRVAARGLGALLKGAMPEKELVKKTLDTGKRMFFTGEIERWEAVSQPIMKNALSALSDSGVIRPKDGKLELSHATAEAVKAGEAIMAEFLDREVPE
jgi:glycerol-3-phosphate O-acyltransferase